MQYPLRLTIRSMIAAGLIAAPGIAAAGDHNPNPYLKPDNSWISISGTVTSVTPDTFELDYGSGSVTVEMDDWDDDADAYKLVKDDNVTVYGRVDDDMFETTTIEASSVYVEGLNTYFHASAADEEDLFVTITAPVVISETVAEGVVTEVNEAVREFTIDTGTRRFTVDTSAMAYNPLDDEGFQKIDVGDRVNVRGHIDADFWKERELMADAIISVSSESDS